MELDVIYNEDCLQTMKSMPDESIDLVVTDCPYHIVQGGATSNKNRLGGILDKDRKDVKMGKLFKHNQIKFSEWLPDVYRVLKQNTHCYIMINGRNLKDLQIEAEKVGFVFQNLLVWRKDNAVVNQFYQNQLEFILFLRKGAAKYINDMGHSNCLSVPNILGNKRHPTEKPIPLMRVMIENSSKKGDVVFDPFMGGGSTAIACMQSDRHFVGCEIDKQYFDVAMQRIKGETKQMELF